MTIPAQDPMELYMEGVKEDAKRKAEEERKKREQRQAEVSAGEMPKPDQTVKTEGAISRSAALRDKIKHSEKASTTQPATGIKELPGEVVPTVIVGPTQGTAKTTSLIPHDPAYYRATGFDVEATYQMKRAGKGFIPFWLTIEDWKDMKPYERAASLAGDIGSTVLIIVGGSGQIKSIASRRPASGVKGTFTKKYPGIRYYTMDDLNAAIRDMKIPGKQKAAMLKKTVPIEMPVEVPVDIAVVKEGPVGVQFLKGTQKINIKPPKTYTPGGKGVATGKPVTTGSPAVRVPSTSTMTVNQLLRLLGISAYTIVRPYIIPGKKGDTQTSPVITTGPGTKIKETETGKPSRGKSAAPTASATENPAATATPTPTPAAAETPVPVATETPVSTAQPEAKAAAQAEPAKTPAKTSAPQTSRVKVIPIGPVKFPRIEGDVTDKRNRKSIKKAKVAVSWRQGELHGKDRYDTIIDPFTANEQYVITLGKQPAGAVVVRGPRSAYNSAQIISGHLTKTGIVDIPGIFHAKLWPVTKTKLGLQFRRDINISKRGKMFPL